MSIQAQSVTVKSKELSQKYENDVLRTLSGKIAGVNIQGGGGAPGQSTRLNFIILFKLKDSRNHKLSHKLKYYYQNNFIVSVCPQDDMLHYKI